jgi:hypothetical protein
MPIHDVDVDQRRAALGSALDVVRQMGEIRR